MKLSNAKREMTGSDAEMVYGLSGQRQTVRACDLERQRIMPMVGMTVVRTVWIEGDFLNVPVKVVEEIPGTLAWNYNGPLCKSQQWRWVIEYPDMEELLSNAQAIATKRFERDKARRKKEALARSAAEETLITVCP